MRAFRFRKKRRKSNSRKKKCNLCGKGLRIVSKFVRFCKTCKENSALFRFHEWGASQASKAA